MANYLATARTNYFRVKSIDELKNDLQKHGLSTGSWHDHADLVIDDDPTNKPDGAIALFSYGGWPSFDEDIIAARLDLDIDDIDEEGWAKLGLKKSLHELIAAHLVDGDVAIFMEVGAEKMRYLSGIALAVNANGETRQVDLEDIYALARTLTNEPANVTHASY